MLFAVASALVNCTNSYDYEEPDPKMVELAKYAKQHVPEQHPKVRTTGRQASRFLSPLAQGICLQAGHLPLVNISVLGGKGPSSSPVVPGP